MEKLFLFVPQWQDSGLTSELYEGAHALKRSFESIGGAPMLEIPVDARTQPVVGNGILGYALIEEQLGRIAEALASQAPQKVFIIGGGCGVEIPVVSYFARRHHDLQLFWFDAHGDLNSPESSPSGHFHGMPLRFLLERQDNSIGRTAAVLPAGSVVLIGARDLDPPEVEYIRSSGIRRLPPAGAEAGAIFGVAGAQSDGGAAYVHIDLDVIDPRYYRNVKCPQADGLTIERLVGLVEAIRERRNLVGLSILENTEREREKIDLLEGLFRIGIGF